MKIWRLVVLAVCTVAFLLTVGSIAFSLSHPGNGRDFFSYWAAGKQAVHHLNPYDAKAVLALEQSTGFSNGWSVMMRNPPPAIVLTLPLGLFSWYQASLLWTGVLLTSLIVSVRLLWIMLGRPPHVMLLGCTFGPALLCLIAGQTSLLLLLGAVLFLRFHVSRPFLAGVSLWLCMLKPHLFLPLGTALLCWSLFSRRFAVIAGCMVALTGSTLLAVYFDPQIWSHYAAMMTTFGIEHEPLPTLGVALRVALNPSLMWLQLVPAVVACLWAGFYFYRHREKWDWIEHGSALLPVSLLVSPYAWSTDQVILLPALLFVIRRASSNAVFAMALGSAMVELAPLFGFDMHSRFHLCAALFWLGLFYMLRLQPINAYDPPPPECIQA